MRLEGFVGERHLRGSPRRHGATGDLVGEAFFAAGLEVVEQPVDGPFGVGRNIVGRLTGSERPERAWVIGAHYDTVVGSPGADDNGVAVAGLIELAALLARSRPRESVELVAWDMEEAQVAPTAYALGSRAMARQAADAGTRIAGVLDLEMIGCCLDEPASQRFPPGFGLLFPRLRRWVEERDGRGDFLAVVANSSSMELARALEDAAPRHELPIAAVEVKGLARLVPDFYRSDHVGFWRHGFPAVMLTDSADFRNEHYHRPTDTVDTLDFDFASRVLATTLDATLALAGAPGRSSRDADEPGAGLGADQPDRLRPTGES